MITDAIISALLAGLTAVFSLLPEWSLPGLGTENGYVAGVYVGAANSVVPVLTMVAIVTAAFGLRALLSAWDFAIHIYHQFWGAS